MNGGLFKTNFSSPQGETHQDFYKRPSRTRPKIKLSRGVSERTRPMPEPAIQNQTHPAPKELAVEMRRLIGVLRQGWRLIAISAVVCLTLAGLYVAAAKRVYQATTRLLVLQQGGRPLNMANSDPNRLMEGTDDYIPTHSMIVCSPMVVKQAIEKVGLEHLPTLLAAKRADKDPVEEAILNMKVTRPDRLAKIFRVDYQAGDRVETDRLVEALVASYQKFLGDTFQKNSGTVITLISKARDDLSKELKELEDQYLEFRRTNANVIVGQGQEGRSFWASRLSRWDQAANEAMVKAVQLKTQLDLGRKLAGDGAELWAIAHAITQVGGDPNSLLALVTAGSSENGEADPDPPALHRTTATGRAARAGLCEGQGAQIADRPDPGARPERPKPPGGRRAQGHARVHRQEPRVGPDDA